MDNNRGIIVPDIKIHNYNQPYHKIYQVKEQNFHKQQIFHFSNSFAIKPGQEVTGCNQSIMVTVGSVQYDRHRQVAIVDNVIYQLEISRYLRTLALCTRYCYRQAKTRFMHIDSVRLSYPQI